MSEQTRFPYPDADVLLKHAKRASARLWNGERDDRAPQLIDELVRHLEDAERVADERERAAVIEGERRIAELEARLCGAENGHPLT